MMKLRLALGIGVLALTGWGISVFLGGPEDQNDAERATVRGPAPVAEVHTEPDAAISEPTGIGERVALADVEESPTPGAAREFLSGLAEGDAILATLAAKGLDVDQLFVPAPLETVRPHLIDAVRWDESAWMSAVEQEMKWSSSGVTDVVMRTRYGLDGGLELAPWQRSEFDVEAEERNRTIRDCVDEYLAAMDQRFASMAENGDWDCTPYTTLPGRKAWEPGPKIYSSRAVGMDGWCVRLHLLEADSQDLIDLQNRHQLLVQERDAYLTALIKKFEKELGH
ncbi:MAG: hypothetical protein R3F34_16945 [Planctomycetota bacterium]